MSRTIQCSACTWLLREPEAATPFYECTNCSSILQAKHANQQQHFQCEQLLRQGKSENELRTNFTLNVDSNLPSKIELEGAIGTRLADNLSNSLVRKDCLFDRTNSHPKTVRTFRAFSRYTATEDTLVDSTWSKENSQGPAGSLVSSVEDISVEDWATTFGSLCSRKDGDEIALTKCFQSVLAPGISHEDEHHLQSEVGSVAHAEQSEDSNMQLNVKKSAIGKAAYEGKAASNFLKQSKSIAFPLQSRCIEDDSVELSLGMPAIKLSIIEGLLDDVSQSDDSVKYSPVTRVTLLDQHANAEGKLNSENNSTLVLPEGNHFRRKGSHGLVAESPQRSEYLHEASSDIYDYEPSEFSSIVDETDAFDPWSPFRSSEDTDLNHTSQVLISAYTPTLREFREVSTSLKKVDARVCHWDHETTDTIMNKKDPCGTENDKDGFISNISKMELFPCIASASEQKNQQPSGSEYQQSIIINTQSSPQGESSVSHASAASTHLSPLHSRGNYIRVQRKQKLQKKSYPYLPSEKQPPYISCQHCRCLLKVPHGLQTYNKISQKLRCGGCSKISVFSVQHPNFIIERSASPGTHSTHSPTYSSKDDGYSSSDDASTSNLKNNENTSLSQVKTEAVNSSNVSKLLYHIESFKLSKRESNRRGKEVSLISIAQGAQNQKAQILKTEERIASNSILRTDPKELCNNSFQCMRTDSDCDSSKSADDTSFATSSPVGMSPLQELFGYESPQKSFGSESPKQMGFKSRMKILVRGRKKDLIQANYESSKITQHKVLVNGHAISYNQVKNAEKSAGPIHPGSYWYDIRAGFWGVMGGPCLGVLAPFIEEFDFPLPRDCSSGKTGILVNGRELHQADLEKLVRRGLPSSSGKAYKAEIDGRVIDEASGKEIRGLGRLAPSIERRGCGYGMFVPVGE